MAAGRHHSMPLPPAAASSGKIKFTLASSVTTTGSPASLFRGEKVHSSSSPGLGGSGSAGRGEAGDRSYAGGRSGNGGGGGGVRDYDAPQRDRERERFRSDPYASKEAARDVGGSGSTHHHTGRYSGRDGVGREVSRDVAKDSSRDSIRDSTRELVRDSGRESLRDGTRDLVRDPARESVRDGTRDSIRDSAREFVRDGTRDLIRDSARESARDAVRESGRDLARESARDTLRDFTRDPQRTAIRDFSRDALKDASRDASRDLTRDSARDVGRDVGRDLGRDPSRDAGRDVSRDVGRDVGRDGGRDYRSRNSLREDFSAKDPSRQAGAGGLYGKEKDRSREREYADKGREKISRDRERDKKEKEFSGITRHQQQHRHSVGESGETDRTLSPLFSRPPSAGGVPTIVSITRNSTSPGGDLPAEKEPSGTGDARNLGPRSSGKDAEREPGELPGGRRLEDISWKSELLNSMSVPPRSARTQQSMEVDSKRSPTKKRKFSPIVWDYDEKHQRSGMVSNKSGASSVSPASKLGGAVASQLSSVQAPAAVPTLPSQAANNATPIPPSKPSSIGQITPTDSTGTRGSQGLSSSPQESTPSPAVASFQLSPVVKEAANDVGLRGTTTQDEMMSSPQVSDDEPEPGQLLPDRDETPVRRSPAESNDEMILPLLTIAKSRWAGETGTPERDISPRASGRRVKKKHSSSVDSDDGRDSLGHEGGNLTSGPSTSPEPGEYIQEKVDVPPRSKERSNDSDGSVGQDSTGKDRRSNSVEDEEYERELNKRELMELEEDDSDPDGEVQRPYVESEFEDLPPPVPAGPQSRGIDMLQGCRSVDEFEKLNKIDEGTYGVVYRARDRKTGEIVALKMVKMEKEKEGFPMTSLREINVLLSFHHPSVVDVKEVVVGSTIDKIYMVMEYMEHDLKGLMETMKQPFSQSEVKCLMLQLLEGVKYLHDNWVLHRDLKTSNLLLNNRGELKICDFGLARQYGSPLKAYTHMVVTLWYRAPELLLGSKSYQYSTAIDMWSVGCIMAEFLAKEPLFNGKSEIDQIDKIFKTLGTPNEKIWPDFANMSVRCNFVRQPYNKLRERFPATAFSGRPTLSEKGFDLLKGLLYYDPQKRLTADDALKHDWFHEVPLPKSKEFMPTFPARSEHDRRVRRQMKSPDPLEEQRKRELRQAELGGGGLFG